MQQLDMASMEGMKSEAMEGLQQSLELTAAEAQSLAQAMRDMKAMQEAMKALQAARQANQLKPLDGQACGQCQGMSEYAALFQSMCKGNGNGNGPGMGGQGQGKGGLAPEDNAVQTDFKVEQASSPMDAGKILMQWKTRELSEKGSANVDYQQAVRDAKQNVNEAIVQEQVPPGYHDSIQKYFDTIDRSTAAPAEGAKP